MDWRTIRTAVPGKQELVAAIIGEALNGTEPRTARQALERWYANHCDACGLEGKFPYRHPILAKRFPYPHPRRCPERECSNCYQLRMRQESEALQQKLEIERLYHSPNESPKGRWLRRRFPNWSEADIAQFLYWEGELSCQQEGKSLLRKIRQLVKPSRRA